MNKVIRFIQNYLVIGFLFALVVPVWSYCHSVSEMHGIEKIVFNVLSGNFMIWTATLVFFVVMLVVLPVAREKTLKRLANVKERDEREQFITGQAARAAYISTLSLTIFFLFFSVFSISVSSYPEKEFIEHKVNYHHSISMNLRFQFFDGAIENKGMAQSSLHPEVLFSSDNYLPSKAAMMLILLFWQLLAFNLAARKEQ